MKKWPMEKWILAFLYMLAFILLREWLLPVMALTDTGHINFFLTFIALAFSFSLLGISPLVSSLLKIIYIFGAVHYIYMDGVLFSKHSSRALVQNMASNFPMIVQGDWESVTDPFRTGLFFILLWMTTYLIRYWVEVKSSILLFYATTVIFVSLLDTFTGYSANGSIVTIMVAGLLLLGFLTILRMNRGVQSRLDLGKLLTMATPLLLVIFGAAIIAYVLPEKEPVWPDPVPFLKSFVGGPFEDQDKAGIAKSGYSPDDSKLGGAFLEDDTLIFEAVVDSKQYWKIETKNTYTSKGWEQVSYNGSYGMYRPGSVIGKGESEHASQAKIFMAEKFPFLVYPYGLNKVDANTDYTILYFPESEQYRTTLGGEEAALDYYEVEFVEQNYSLQALHATKMADFSGEDFNEFLQLPDSLPERVSGLAETITTSSGSVYEKAKSIERYFASNGFTYDQRNVAVPGEGEDYVDQFLFDTKRGYCDNFSTSMVVMLRTIGIPARWAKGFAPGESVRYADGEQVYRITNKEAHSWVEAYMPGIGWMPFEPTIGFSGPATVEFDLEVEQNDIEMHGAPEKEQERTERETADDQKKDLWGGSIAKVSETIGQSIRSSVLSVVLVLTFMALISFGLYAIRRKWMPKLILFKNRTKIEEWDTYALRYQKLLKQLARAGLHRRSGETLYAYANRIDLHFEGNQMRQLTTAYEKGLYGGEKVGHDWEQLQNNWEHLMNRTSD